MRRTLLTIAFLTRVAFAEDPVILTDGPWTIKLWPSTLATVATRGERSLTLSRAVFGPATVTNLETKPAEAHWKLPDRKLTIVTTLKAEGFRIAFRTTEPGTVTWPALGAESGLEAVILPRGEGFYIPVKEARWRTFLQVQSPFDTMEGLSMPMWGLRYPGVTIAYIAENPFDNQLRWTIDGSELRSRLTHRFQPNAPEKEHSILVRFGGTSPVEAAVLFNEWFRAHHAVTTWAEKIKALPDAEKLLGAAHIYLWAHSQLSAEDVTNWPGLVRALADEKFARFLSEDTLSAVHEAGGHDFVTLFQKRAILAALDVLLDGPEVAGSNPILRRAACGVGQSRPK